MREESSKRRRLFQRTSDRVLLIIALALAVLTIALSILQRFGLTPINGAIQLYLPILTLFVLVGWGGYALIRRISNRTVKLLVGGGLGLLLVLALLLVFTYVSYMAFYLMPQRYSVIVSPSGTHRLVVMRGFDTDEARMQQRKAARLAANPDDSEEDSVADWGYAYRAYPLALGMFYRSNADVEGEVCLAIDEFAGGTQSESSDESAEPETARGTLMVEWLEEESVAHFFAENPGVAEGGDCYVRF